jgi:hypothetical protein
MLKHSSKPPALVLLGYHGIGKDTIARMVETDYKGVGNVKFGALNKRMVAEIFNFCPSYLENHDFRSTFDCMETYGIGGQKLSPLDLLNVMFSGMQADTSAARNLSSACHAYTLQVAEAYALPVFTDIRNMSEMEAVADKFDKVVVHLRDLSLQPGLGDSNVDEVAEAFADIVFDRLPGQPVRTYVKLKRAVASFLELRETNEN